MDISVIDSVGVVVIGRNEGQRLRRCVQSLPQDAHCVYVDSASTDGSVELARSLRADTVSLDASKPLSAARARNAGFERLLSSHSELEFAHFVDGDCELAEGWLERGLAELRARPDVAVVSGRIRERERDRSIYNRLCDMEWDAPAGEALSSGGIAMVRTAALRQVGGFREDLIAGEEPELCFRLRQAGWRIYRADAEMASHDAAMTRFGQWWKRAVRGGHAYAEGAWLHGRSPERYRVRQVSSIALWGAALPLLALSAAPMTHYLSLLLLLAYVPLEIKIARGMLKRGRQSSEAHLYAGFTVLSKFAQLCGLLRFLAGRLSGRRTKLIEYQKARSLEDGGSAPSGVLRAGHGGS